MPFGPFTFKIRTGDLAMESLGTGAQGGGARGETQGGGKVLFLLFALLAFTLFSLFAFYFKV